MIGSADQFWRQTEAILAERPAEVQIHRDPFYSQPEWDVYQMRYRSVGGYWLFAWLSVPKGGGTFPAIVRMPDYGSVHDIVYTSLRERAVVMNPTYRGQRQSDQSFHAEYPGLLTEGIEDQDTYVMRKVFADALRGYDALFEQNVCHVGKTALIGAGLGGSLALAVAARRESVDAVAADTPMALGNAVSLESGLAYPLAELDDYLRMTPESRDSVTESTSVLDPLLTASQIVSPVLLSVGANDTGSCPLAYGEELAGLIHYCDLRVYHGASEGGGHEHDQIRLSWLSDKLGLG